MLCVLASASAAQVTARQRAPIIRVYSENGAYVLETTSYVSPAIQVSENAYVFAVMMDLDGHIQVLHPDFPGISVRMLAHRQLRLPNFFAGFAQRSRGDAIYASTAYSAYDGYYDGYEEGYVDSRGTVIALASRAPFDLERIESGGDWNIPAIRQLIERRTPEMAAQALASYLGAKGEPIGRDFMRFAGARHYNYYALDSYDPCDLYTGFAYAPTLGFRRFQAYNRLNLLRQNGQQVRILGYDICGAPIISYAPITVVSRFPVTRPPQARGDTTVFPKARFPGLPTPRHPAQSAADAAPEGIPVSRSGLPQMGDVTIQAPRGRHSEPLQIFEGYRPQPGTMAAPQGRIPLERVMPQTVPAATGALPVREYRPEPRVETPPPTRVPDRPIASPPPAPVVRERPTAPPPPPPRTETSKSEPARVPPPNKR
jgi:hypothetical protein